VYAIYPLFEYYSLAGKMHGLVRAGDPLPEATVERSPIMSSASSLAKVIAPSDVTAQAAEIVEKFLVASMVPDPETAAKYIAEPLKLTFTGGRKFTHPRESTAFNAKRYKWVKKKMERSDVAPGDGETIVYNTGTLYGEWPDGTPFEGNRYVDRFVVRSGKIVQMDVWNDSAERLLTRNGIDA
jgi:hypothetical protein